MESLANFLVLGALGYVALGLVFAVGFVWRGLTVVDPAAEGASLGLRLLLCPGAVALWPVLLRRWLKTTTPPAERNRHRRAARAVGDPR